jgi:hypothetical protein
MNFEKEQIWRRLADKTGNYYSESAEPEREEFRKWLKELLFGQEVLLEFTKADGTARVMKCTLNTDLGAKYKTEVLVENFALVQDKPKKVNNDTCAVWDIEAGAWRSFRWDRLIRIDFKI